ncbi:unnamed protein product [Porites evermanni]|uniref:Uncharacterized protein n=1 Tax=Porites evermanni TaxID=104178 RepID=A0ABN8PCE1_9CNID|nr:unnamed protein product [Porites evermanni]
MLYDLLKHEEYRCILMMKNTPKLNTGWRISPEPAKLVKGVSTNLKSAWNYLDQNCGDPSIVSDVVISDIKRYKAVQTGKDHRFCDLVNLLAMRFLNFVKCMPSFQWLATRMLKHSCGVEGSGEHRLRCSTQLIDSSPATLLQFSKIFR